MLYQSKSGRYRVQVAPDGAIQVRHGDCLSNYSAAIYNNPWTINVFRRRAKSGKLIPIPNPNVIFTGETLYHTPTFLGSDADKIKVDERIDWEKIPVSELEKKKLVIAKFKREIKIKGWSGWPEDMDASFSAHTLTEILEMVEAFDALPELVSAMLLPASFLTFTIHGTYDIVKSWHRGLDLIGWRAAPYGTTAWAFDDPLPPPPAWCQTTSPAVIQAGLKSADGSVRSAAQAIQFNDVRYQQAWKDACQEAANTQDKKVADLKIKKKDYQQMVRLIGGLDRNRLLKMMLQRTEDEYLKNDPNGRKLLWEPPPQYPNQ